MFVVELLSQTLLNLIWDLENVASADGCFGKRKKKKSCLCVTCVLSHAVCAEAFNPDEDEEEKEPLVIIASFKRSFLLKIRADSSETFDGVAPGFAGHAPQNRRAEAETAGGLLGHPPLQESGPSESSSRRPTLYVATGTLPFLIPVNNICLFANLTGGDVAGAGRHV